MVVRVGDNSPVVLNDQLDLSRVAGEQHLAGLGQFPVVLVGGHVLNDLKLPAGLVRVAAQDHVLRFLATFGGVPLFAQGNNAVNHVTAGDSVVVDRAAEVRAMRLENSSQLRLLHEQASVGLMILKFVRDQAVPLAEHDGDVPVVCGSAKAVEPFEYLHVVIGDAIGPTVEDEEHARNMHKVTKGRDAREEVLEGHVIGDVRGSQANGVYEDILLVADDSGADTVLDCP